MEVNKPMFRDLRADEIECRVAQAAQKGVSLLLYKDARCDQNILDETVGPMNWQRYHARENANCVVQIWDEGKGQWIGKEDTGTESNTEKEKGLASDSFKRACFNWGIGRELYTAPFIWVPAAKCEELEKDDKRNRWKCNDKFEVGAITIVNKRITELVICNAATGKPVYTMGKVNAAGREDGLGHKAPAANTPKEKSPEKTTFKKADVIKDVPEKSDELDPVCSACKKPVAALMRNGVVTKTADEVIKWSNETFDKTLCWSCAKKEMDSREAG